MLGIVQKLSFIQTGLSSERRVIASPPLDGSTRRLTEPDDSMLSKIGAAGDRPYRPSAQPAIHARATAALAATGGAAEERLYMTAG
jgi:hypothetical protein